MSSPQVYSKALVTIDGKLLFQHASVTVTQNSGNQPVNTVNGGWAGVSPGSPSTEIDIENAVPANGWEYEPSDKMNGVVAVTIGVYAAGTSLTCKGFIMSNSFKHAVNSEAMQSLKFGGGAAKFE